MKRSACPDVQFRESLNTTKYETAIATLEKFDLRVRRRQRRRRPIFGLVGAIRVLSALYRGYREWARALGDAA